MKITIAGNPGSGKSSVSKVLAERLKLKRYSAGDFMREIAKKRGLSIIELSRIAEGDESIDREIDERTKQIGKEEDDFVMDTRLGFHWIEDSVKVFIKVNEKTGAERVLKQKRDEEKFKDVKDAVAEIKRRMESEKIRYMDLYGIDCYDESLYDIIIDSSKISVEEVVDKIVKGIKTKDL